MPFTLIHSKSVTIPAGTPQATPFVGSVAFPPAVVDHIVWRFPGGCNGQVGIQIGARSVPVLPGDNTQFFVQSGDTSGFDLEEMHDSGDWSVIGFNTGAFPHTIQVTFKVHRRQPSAQTPGYLVADAIDVLAGGY